MQASRILPDLQCSLVCEEVRQEATSVATLAAACIALLVALLRRGFLGRRGHLGPTEPPLWGAREILTVFGVYILSSVVLAPLFVPMIHPKSPIDSSGQALALVVYLLLSWIPAMGLMVYYVRIQLGQPASTLGFQPVPWRNIAGCVPLYLLLIVPQALVTVLWLLLLRESGVELQEQDLLGTFRDAAARGDVLSFVALGAAAVVIAPLCEETFFRGFLFGVLRQTVGPTVAAVVSSAVFALVHMSLSASAAIFCLGLVLCGIYARTGSLYPAISFHALFNGVTVAKAAYDSVHSTT
jgi:hypothetical protein